MWRPSETAARFVYPNEDSVGRPLPYGGIDQLDIAPRAPIVAVVDDMKYQGLAAPRAGSISSRGRGCPPACRTSWCGPPAIRWPWPRRFATSSGR